MNPNKPNIPAPTVEPDELSYYRLTLLSYLRESHPELATDEAFIRARADLAAEAFSNAVRSGMDYDEAVRQADEVLFQACTFPGSTRSSPCYGTSLPTKCPQAAPARWLSSFCRMWQGVQRLRPDRRFRVYPRLRPAVRGTGRCNLNLARRKWHITRRRILGTTSRPSA